MNRSPQEADLASRGSCAATLVGCAFAVLVLVGRDLGGGLGDVLAAVFLSAWLTLIACVFALPAWLLVFRPLALVHGIEGRWVRPLPLAALGALVGWGSACLYTWLFGVLDGARWLPVSAGAVAGASYRWLARRMGEFAEGRE